MGARRDGQRGPVHATARRRVHPCLAPVPAGTIEDHRGMGIGGEGSEPRQLFATLHHRAHSEGVQRPHQMLPLAFAGLSRILTEPNHDPLAVLTSHAAPGRGRLACGIPAEAAVKSHRAQTNVRFFDGKMARHSGDLLLGRDALMCVGCHRRPLQPDPTIAEDFMWSDNYDNLSEAMLVTRCRKNFAR